MGDDYDIDYDDYDYLQNLGETGDCGMIDSLDGEDTYTFLDNPDFYNEDGDYEEPKQLEGVRKIDEWGYKIDETPLDYIEDAEFVEDEVLPKVFASFAKLDADDIAATARALDHLGYQGFWDTVDSHALYFEPANAHWRRDQHDERHYVMNEEGQLVASKYEQARVRKVLRKLRAQNPEYYRAVSKAAMANSNERDPERNRKATAKSRAKAKAENPEKYRAQKRAQMRRYRAKKKLLKQQQQQLNQLTKDNDNV